MAEIKVQRCIIINLPAQEVFAYLCDLNNMMDWSSTTISMRQTSPGEMSTGAIVSSTFRFLGKWLNVIFEIVEFRPGSCLTLKSIAGSPSCFFRYQLEEHIAGVTLISEEAKMQILGGPTEPANAVITSAVTRQIEYDLQTLKEIMEAGAFLS